MNRVYEIKFKEGNLVRILCEIEKVFFEYYQELFGLKILRRDYVNSSIVK